MAYPKEKSPFPPIVVDRLLRTLCGFVSRAFLRKSFATTPEGRLNFYSPSRRPRNTRPGSGSVPYRYTWVRNRALPQQEALLRTPYRRSSHSGDSRKFTPRNSHLACKLASLPSDKWPCSL